MDQIRSPVTASSMSHELFEWSAGPAQSERFWASRPGDSHPLDIEPNVGARSHGDHGPMVQPTPPHVVPQPLGVSS